MGDDAFMGQVGMMLDQGKFTDFNDIGAAWISDNSFAMMPTYNQINLESAPLVQRYLVERVEVIQQPLVAMGAGGPVKEDMFSSFTSAFGAAKRSIGHDDTMIVVTDLTRREPRCARFPHRRGQRRPHALPLQGVARSDDGARVFGCDGIRRYLQGHALHGSRHSAIRFRRSCGSARWR